ncbi:MAG: glycosyltransferase family 4 protein [Bacteroidaceae bacterium]|nr:glycosyltransferase family 4 protein [Bacteroidaceae bacterium]
MQKLLIISKEQFGYHTDIFKWCEHLRDEYAIEIITFEGKPKIGLKGIKNYYVSNKGQRSIRGLRYILTCLWHILFFKGIIVVCYFKECRIFKICFPWKKMLLDIRTLDVSNDKATRNAEDAIIKKSTDIYDYVTIISEGLRKKLNLPESKSAILPLGADEASTTIKTFKKLHLLYVGTLFNRDIHKTIEGLSIALKEEPTIDIHYDIIGEGVANELEELKNLVTEKGLEDHITLHGYIQHEELKPFLDNCNIGVSFVPVTEYYEHQPATKSFEYILSGLYTIATGTYCNKEIITKKNGVIIEDTPESFAESIIDIFHRKEEIDGSEISKTLSGYKWENVVNKQMKNILNHYYKKYHL